MMEILIRIVDYGRSGGFLMLPIIAVSLMMWGMIIVKLQELYEVNRHDFSVKEAVAWVQQGQEQPLAGTPLRHVVFHFIEKKTTDRETDLALLSTLINREISRLSNNLSYIYILAAVAPLLGLLGTVGGMISTFDAIAVFGTGNARAMAQGISEALVTTQSGLFVSIPGLFMASFLNRRISRIAQHLEEFRAAIMQGNAAST